MSISTFVMNFLYFETNNIFPMSRKNKVISIANVISNAYSEIFLFKMQDTKSVENYMNENISRMYVFDFLFGISMTSFSCS